MTSPLPRKNHDLIEGIPITFAVDMWGYGYIVEVPKERENWFDGAGIEDNFHESGEQLKGLAPGLYRGTFSFEFCQGYFEGYPADGESDTYLCLEKFEKVA